MSDRSVVKTYVPPTQKTQWQAHAEELDMSQSEFVRTMVQAGRRGFEGLETESSDADPGGRDLEAAVLGALAEGPKSFDELLATITDDIEAELDSTLQELQSAGRVRYSGRAGGYVAND